jgi:uncharacterized protein YbjT (DUF2867 family)
MTATGRKVIVVTGATGLQGRAVTRHLLAAGWQVRALTRKAASQQAQALAASGAEVVQGNLEDGASLRPIFAGAYGVYSVQNPYISGPEAEVRQGKQVATVARESGIQHLVYASAGTGQLGTGIPSWETKLQIEAYMKALNLPLTILRPTAFMELMTHPKFFPMVAMWHVMPRVLGTARRLPWLCTDDLGVITAQVFAAPQRFLGQDLTLASDMQSLAQCQTLYREVMGRHPPHFPLPLWLFRRFGFVGRDLTTMWQWLRTGPLAVDPTLTRTIHPAALTVRAWLSRQKAASTAAP